MWVTLQIGNQKFKGRGRPVSYILVRNRQKKIKQAEHSQEGSSRKQNIKNTKADIMVNFVCQLDRMKE